MEILMPQLGETVNEGTISVWHKKVGETVVKDEVLLDVETDKVAMEILSPASGVLTVVSVQENEVVEVGTVLAVVAVEGEDADGLASESNADPHVVEDIPRVASHRDASPIPAASDKDLKLSPAIRRLVAEHKLDVSTLQGSGREGRITRRDVLYVLRNAVTDVTSVARNALSDRKIAFDRVRKITAEHMVRSKAISPHVLQAIEVDFYNVDKFRLARKTEWKQTHGFSLSYLPFIAYALCRAIEDFPKVNASVEEDSLQLHGAINLAVAVDLDHEGLVAPVLRAANGLKVYQLALGINELVQKARLHTLVVDDLSGGTYTLSNPGPYGTLFTAAIINQPQVAILSTDVVRKKPVVVETENGDTIGIRPVGILSQSFDHRAFDGAYSAAFLNRLKSLIEQENWELNF